MLCCRLGVRGDGENLNNEHLDWAKGGGVVTFGDYIDTPMYYHCCRVKKKT